jgi:hypothetical protein
VRRDGNFLNREVNCYRLQLLKTRATVFEENAEAAAARAAQLESGGIDRASEGERQMEMRRTDLTERHAAAPAYTVAQRAAGALVDPAVPQSATGKLNLAVFKRKGAGFGADTLKEQLAGECDARNLPVKRGRGVVNNGQATEPCQELLERLAAHVGVGQGQFKAEQAKEGGGEVLIEKKFFSSGGGLQFRAVGEAVEEAPRAAAAAAMQ